MALNTRRAEEESRGIVRWLRPEFQNPTGSASAQGALALPTETKPAKPKAARKAAFPKSLAEQARAVRSALQTRGKPAAAQAGRGRGFNQSAMRFYFIGGEGA